MCRMIVLITMLLFSGCHSEKWRCIATIQQQSLEVLQIDVLVEEEMHSGGFSPVASPSLIVKHGESAEILLDGPAFQLQITVLPDGDTMRVTAKINGQSIPVTLRDLHPHPKGDAPLSR